MRILALETTERIGSLAAMCDGRLLAEIELDPHQRSAQSLAPGMKALLEGVGWRPADVDLVALTVGPGSFTGLRVEVTAAKVFAYAAGAQVLGVDTLETIAAASPHSHQAVSVGVDAQRGEVVARAFRRHADGWFRPLAPAELLDLETWIANLPVGMALSGPVLRKLAGRLPPGVRVLGPRCWGPRASQVARLAARDSAAGRRDDLWTLAPRYSRRSAAEEKWARRRADY